MYFISAILLATASQFLHIEDKYKADILILEYHLISLVGSIDSMPMAGLTQRLFCLIKTSLMLHKT